MQSSIDLLSTARSNNKSSKNHFKAMAMEENVEENGPGGPINADTSLDPSILYLIMPSYAEPYKQEIKHIIKSEKERLR